MDGLPESEDALLLVDSSPNSRQASRRTTDRPPAVPLSDASTGHRPPQQPPPGPSQSSSELTSLADEDDDEGNLIQVDSPSQATLALRTGAQGGSSRRVPSPATSAPPTQPQLLPLPLLSHALHTLFSSPPPSGGSPLALGWQLVRSSLASSHSSLSPREELELRRLDGALGVRVLACLKARSGVEEGWKEKGREVERSLGKAVSLCQKHSHLSSQYLIHLVLLQSELTGLLDSPKLAVKRLSPHLTSPLFRSTASQVMLRLTLSSLHETQLKPHLASSVLGDLSDLLRGVEGAAEVRSVVGVARMAAWGRLGEWGKVLEVGLELVEGRPGFFAALGNNAEGTGEAKVKSEIVLGGLPPSEAPAPEDPSSTTPPTESAPKTALDRTLLAHALLLVALARNHLGQGSHAGLLVKRLHRLLDEGSKGWEGKGGGLMEVPVGLAKDGSERDVVQVQMTAPHTLYVLACLVTALAKRDPTGKRPKKRLFAEEGLRQLEMDEGETDPPVSYAPFGVGEGREQRTVELAGLKAELMLETAGVAVVRSEFGTASQILNKLTGHLRQTDLFHRFAPQVTLLQAYLAHSTAQSDVALDLYAAAAHLASTPSADLADARANVDCYRAARLGRAGLLVGLGRAGEVGKDVRSLARDVWGGLGASVNGVGVGAKGKEENVGLRIAGGLLLGVLEDEILKSKQFMKSCLDLSSASADNTSKPIILSLTAALFVNTREKQSMVMLETALQMARSLGPEGAGGNAALGSWLGEKYEAVMRKHNKVEKAETMVRKNASHRSRLEAIRRKAGSGAYQTFVVDGFADA